MLDILGKYPVLFNLSSEQILLVGTSCWIRDPLDTNKNVARPSYAFKQIQQLFSQYLSALEKEHMQLCRLEYSSGKSHTTLPPTSNMNSNSHNPNNHNYQTRERSESYHNTNQYYGHNRYNHNPNHNPNNPYNGNNRTNWNPQNQHRNNAVQGNNSYNYHTNFHNNFANRSSKSNSLSGKNNIFANQRNNTNDEPDLLKAMMRY